MAARPRQGEQAVIVPYPSASSLFQRLICAAIFWGDGAPTARRCASESATSKIFATSSSKCGENSFISRPRFDPVERFLLWSAQQALQRFGAPRETAFLFSRGTQPNRSREDLGRALHFPCAHD